MVTFKMAKKKQETKREEAIKNIDSSDVGIRIYTSMGGQTRVLKANFIATEKRNEFDELVAYNSEKQFEENVDFQIDSTYRELRILLNIQNMDKKTQVKHLNKAILKQEKKIYFLNRVLKLNAIFNYQDEKKKLRDYRVIKKHIKKEEDGGFYKIENGRRVYEFESIDGFMIPLFQGTDSFSSYPEHIRNKKIKLQGDERFRQEMAEKRMNQQAFKLGVAVLIIAVILIGVNVFWSVKNYDLYQNAEVTKAQTSCLESTRRINEQYGKTVEKILDERQSMQATQQKLIDTVEESNSRGENYINELIPSET